MRILIDGDVLLYLAVATSKEDTPESALERFDGIVTDIAESHFSTVDDCEIYLSHGDNFRKTHWPTYKSNRKAKPELIPQLKDLVTWDIGWDQERFVVLCNGHEADDELLIRACDLNDQGVPWSIATVDKDLRTQPGRFYDVRKQEHKVVTPGEAYTFMIQQFVMGDSVDGIPGLRGWGPKKTASLIHDGQTLIENLEMAKEIWRQHNGEGWEQAFNETCNLAFIRRHTDDLQPLDFAGMSESVFKKKLRLHI